MVVGGGRRFHLGTSSSHLESIMYSIKNFRFALSRASINENQHRIVTHNKIRGQTYFLQIFPLVLSGTSASGFPGKGG